MKNNAADISKTSIPVEFQDKAEQDVATILFEGSRFQRMIEKDFSVSIALPTETMDAGIDRVVVSGGTRNVKMAAMLLDRIKKDPDITPASLNAGDIRRLSRSVRIDTEHQEKHRKHSSPASKPQKAANDTRITLVQEFNALTANQQIMRELLSTQRVVLAEGPAGVGKSFVAMHTGAEELAAGRVDNLILSVAAITNGRDPGAMPGGPDEKNAPYLRPLIEVANDVFGEKQVAALRKKGIIKTLTFEQVQGLTLKNSFVILDEAQSTWPSQMESFLTRIGKGTTMAVLGSHRQTIQQQWRHNATPFNGFADAIEILSGKQGIGVVRFTWKDIVRDDIVQTIVEAYENRDRARETERPLSASVLDIARAREHHHQKFGR